MQAEYDPTLRPQKFWRLSDCLGRARVARFFVNHLSGFHVFSDSATQRWRKDKCKNLF